MLNEGKSPAEARAAFIKASSPNRAAATPTTQKNDAPAATDGQPAKAEPTASQLGIDEKELGALKRAKFDLNTLAHIPPANRKTIARGLMAAQAETDRQFQAAKQQGQTQTPGTQPSQDGATGTGQQPGQKAEGQAAPASAPVQPAQGDSVFAPYKLADADLATLTDIGGKEFGETMQRVLPGLVAHQQQQLAPLLGVLNHVLERFESQDVNEGLAEARKRPGFEKVGESETDRKALLDKARTFYHAAAKPGEYGMKQAVQDAVGALFSVNAQQAAQAQLASARTASLASSPDKGLAGNKANRPMSEGDRSREIYRLMAGGKSGAEARAIVDAR